MPKHYLMSKRLDIFFFNSFIKYSRKGKKIYCYKNQINDSLGDRVRGMPAIRSWKKFYRKWK